MIQIFPKPSFVPKSPLTPLISLLVATVMLIPFNRNVLFLPSGFRIIVGLVAVIMFGLSLRNESAERRLKYLALAFPLGLLTFSPVNTSLSAGHFLSLGLVFAAVLIIPSVMLRNQGVITFKFWPEKLDRIDIAYTLISVPLAWAAVKLYLTVLSPEVRFNWVLPAEQSSFEVFKLFMGINAVGIWDELFFVNISFAIIRSLFPFRIANPAQAVIYMSVLYDMAFSGWGPLFVYSLAITQGAMYERSKALIWVLIVHLIVDYFLFQTIVSAYYPDLSVWWHP